MNMKRIIFFLLLSIICGNSIAQRHYGGIKGSEIYVGNNLTGDFNPYLSIGISKYLSRTAYIKFALNQMETTSVATRSVGVWKSNEIFVNGMYYKMVYSNEANVFLNLGAGGFIGSEKWFDSSKLMAGSMVGIEGEYFFGKKYAILLSLNELYSVLSDVRQWNTVFSVGLKILLY